MFYVYRCNACHQLGFQQHEGLRSLSCSVCGADIEEYIRAPNLEQARLVMSSLSAESSQQVRPISRGRGVQARVLDIVECLVDGNRGRPVRVSAVLNECSDADIPTERAWHFLNRLEAIERIRLVGKEVTLL